MVGVATGDMDVGRDGKPNHTSGMELRGKYTLLAEGARGLKYPLIYVTPKAPVNVAFWRRSSAYRSTSGRRRASGMLAMRS